MERTPIAFVSGKYRGDIPANIKRARKAAAKLWNLGYVVICPHLMTTGLDTAGCTITDGEFIRRLLALVDISDIIFMLEEWEESEGAGLEHWGAKNAGVTVYYEPDWPPEVNQGPELEHFISDC